MSNSKLIFSFYIFFCFFISFASSSSFNTTHKCSAQETLALLLFKQYFSPNFSTTHYTPCQDWLGSNYYPIMMNWNKNADCCNWDGVTCSHFTGDVIGIDLSCGMLRGTIHPNSTLFHLPHLKTLNLAFNDFIDSQLPLEIGKFSSSLTHLNLSGCGFTGVISSGILFLPKLASLDLSMNYGLQIQPYVLENLLRNSTHLRELLISGVDIGWVLPSFPNISSSLRSLDLSYTGLQGMLHDNIFSLQYLEKLDLSGNNQLTGSLPIVSTSNNIPLKWLALSSVNLSGETLNSIGHFESLNYLDLSFCGLVGSLPKSLDNLRHLITLDLSGNKLNGTLPSLLFTLPLLENVNLDVNMFSGGLPSEFYNCRSLRKLSLGKNQFGGEINERSTPPSFIQLVNLTHLDLRWNNFTGLWDLDTLLSSLPNLKVLYLSYSGLSLSFNTSASYVNHELWYLGLASCKLALFPYSLRALKNLRRLDLSDNNIQGHIPDWTQEIGGNELLSLDLSNNSITGLTQFQWDGLQELYLQSNQIQGPFPPSICNLRNLDSLDISYNNFIGVIPHCLGNIISSLRYLYLQSNQIQGPLPSSFCNMRYLEMLDISNNSFSGVLPHCLGNISSSLWSLNVKSNQIQGPFPSSICNLSGLTILDMSNNSFNGVIPQCLENIISSVSMIDMSNNHFHGTIPNVYKECGQLEGLILNGNRLQGVVPSSLSKCQSLKVLDLGNNQLNDTFPGWLSNLPMLQVLVLKSNKLHGPIETASTNKSGFQSMKVLDLSHNGFLGHLPGKYFQNFNAMKDVVRKGLKPEYLNMSGKYYSIIVAVKGVEQKFPKILVDYTIIDLSNNKFDGEIPGAISSLSSLIVLNLSHNSLTGQIPYGLGNLSEIESLDLSWNQLTGEIPQSLADLTFLGFLNLSQNHLVGRIPSGTQFSTFGTSFGGNVELCGLPLPTKCEHPLEPKLEDDEDTESGFTWRVVILGYGCGTLPGLVMGYIMLSTGRPKWFNAIVDAGEHLIRTWRNKKLYVYIGQ